MLGAGLGIPSEPHSSKVRLIVLLSNRMTSDIHALNSSVIVVLTNSTINLYIFHVTMTYLLNYFLKWLPKDFIKFY